MELLLEELLIDSVKILTLWYVFITILAYFIGLSYTMYVEIMCGYPIIGSEFYEKYCQST
jgi:hypothetical protein